MLQWIQAWFPPGQQLVLRGLPLGWAFTLAALLVVLVVVAARFQIGSPSRRPRVMTLLLRLLAIALTVPLLTAPVMRVRQHSPQDTYVVHVFDTSGSMAIPDMQGQSRIDATANALNAGSPARSELRRQFRELNYTFDEQLRMHNANEKLVAEEKATDLHGMLQALGGQLRGLPISAVALYSDGNATINERRSAVIDAATQLNLPVYTIGTAPQTPGPDFWIEKVDAPDETNVLVSTPVKAIIGARGMAGREVDAVLKIGGREVQRRTIQPGQDQQSLIAEFDLQPSEEGTLACEVALETKAQTSYPWNDTQPFFMQVRKKRYTMLYLEGRPRFEYRFLRLAFETDARFRVVSVVTLSADKQLYRQGLTKPTDLETGFPTSREELFGYDVVVLGDMPPAAFTPPQLTDLRDFVSIRGGGLMLLAGEHSFGAANFSQGPLAAVLPFTTAATQPNPNLIRLMPTQAGLDRGLFGPQDAAGHASTWSKLPQLSGVYTLGALKPGATSLCTLEGSDELGAPVVAMQRFGRGISLVSGMSATWPWKLRMPSDNTSFVTFWKQMMLLLGDRAMRHIELEVRPTIAAVGSDVTVRGNVLNEKFEPESSAAIQLELESPDGKIEPLTLDAAPDKGFTFTRKLSAPYAGVYKVRASIAGENSASSTSQQAVFLARAEAPERREVRLNEALLRDIAKATGGSYFHLSQVDELARAIKPREGTRQKIEERPLYDSGIMMWILLGIFAADWTVRRLGRMA